MAAAKKTHSRNHLAFRLSTQEIRHIFIQYILYDFILDLVNDLCNYIDLMKRKKASAHPDRARHAGFEPRLLREVIRTHQVLMNGYSREVGMPASRFALMGLLAASLPDAVGIMDLARRLGINAAAVTRQIQELESERLVLRHPDGRDGRRYNIKLSAKGLKLFQAIHNRSHELERSLASAIGPGEMTAAADVLARLRRFLEGLR